MRQTWPSRPERRSMRSPMFGSGSRKYSEWKRLSTSVGQKKFWRPSVETIKAPRSSDAVYSIPGKTFLIGEYAVLAQDSIQNSKKMPAVIAAVAPRFSLRVIPGRRGLADFAIPGSPVAKLLDW